MSPPCGLLMDTGISSKDLPEKERYGDFNTSKICLKNILEYFNSNRSFLYKDVLNLNVTKNRIRYYYNANKHFCKKKNG